jgi:hypothetical protein
LKLPNPDGEAYHGFDPAAVRLNAVVVKYIDEYGGEFFTERFENSKM